MTHNGVVAVPYIPRHGHDQLRLSGIDPRHGVHSPGLAAMGRRGRPSLSGGRSSCRRVSIWKADVVPGPSVLC